MLLCRSTINNFVGPSRARSSARFFSSLYSFAVSSTPLFPKQVQQRSHSRSLFIPLHKSEEEVNNEEVTLYIKGFLAKGESPDRFEKWIRSHANLTQSHGWGTRAHGYHWNSGDFLEAHLPYGTLVTGAFQLFTAKKFMLTPPGIAIMLASEAVALGGRIWYEFKKATDNAKQHAPQLAEHLQQIGRKHPRVRLVAHSLGCALATEALKQLDESERPHEIHFLAPAMDEQFLVPRLAKEQTYLYYCQKDLILQFASKLFYQTETLGLHGPQQEWEGITPVNVTDKFGFFVHQEYKNMWDKIAFDHRLRGFRADAIPDMQNTEYPEEMEYSREVPKEGLGDSIARTEFLKNESGNSERKEAEERISDMERSPDPRFVRAAANKAFASQMIR